MTKENNDSKLSEPEKLSIDNPSDFQFHAAYLAYADTYDKTADNEVRKQLNDNITALKQNQIDYATFYSNISQYRKGDGQQTHHGRPRIRTQRKKEWRRRTEKQQRNRRYRK